MKAVLQAGWLLTVAVGNFIVLIVAEIANLPKQVSFNMFLSHGDMSLHIAGGHDRHKHTR